MDRYIVPTCKKYYFLQIHNEYKNIIIIHHINLHIADPAMNVKQRVHLSNSYHLHDTDPPDLLYA